MSAPRLGVVIPTRNDAAGAVRCLQSLGCLDADGCPAVVVDDASTVAAREALTAAVDGRVEMLQLEHNRGFAAAVNAGLEVLFRRDVDAALVVNDDATGTSLLMQQLALAVREHPGAGILAPRVLDDVDGHEVSRGERVTPALVCVPRSLLRVRAGGPAAYPVSGVLGVAFVVTRACYERVGPLAEQFFAYYEEVDYCLRARRAGFEVMVVPAAAIRHAGFRGFAGGFTPLAAYLKARNLPELASRHVRAAGWLVFVPSYVALMAASALIYAMRGETRVLAALGRGVLDGLRRRTGTPPVALRAPAVD